MDILVKLSNYQCLATLFASLALVELLSLLNVLENQVVFFYTVALHGQQGFQLILTPHLGLFSCQDMPDAFEPLGKALSSGVGFGLPAFTLHLF